MLGQIDLCKKCRSRSDNALFASNTLDTSMGSRMDHYKIPDKYGK